MSRFLIASIFLLAVASNSQAASGKHDPHTKTQIVIAAKIKKIITYENGMSLMLDREFSDSENCVHVENAASFDATKLERLETAKLSNSPITLKIVDGHLVDVVD